jgi:hypothetical protein
MSIGPAGSPESVAGSPAAQVHGADVERALAASGAQTRRTEAHQRAEQAAGVGRTQEEHEAGDRDADGRQPWEIGRDCDAGTDARSAHGPAPPAEPLKSRDATGQRGNHVDLYG